MRALRVTFMAILVGAGGCSGEQTNESSSMLANGVATCGTAAEGSRVRLACPSGQTISGIEFASYGTPGGSCGAFTPGGCNAARSSSVVASACLGKASCAVRANNATFGDPCPGVDKRLDIQVACNGAATGTGGSVSGSGGSITGSGGAAAGTGGINASAGSVCGTAAEGTSLTLRCGSGQVVTRVDFASYGTPLGACGAFTVGGCHASTSSSVVSTACLGNASCTVAASNATFGDPCVGADKRLSVQLTCGVGTVTGSGGTIGNAGTGGTTTSTGAATIVPLYTDPGDASWSAIISAKRAHPGVSVIAIVNPANGPDTSINSSYTSGISALVSAGIRVIGYVHTSYGARDAAQVRAELQNWHAWYPLVSGIFLDEESNVSGHETYYRDLSTYAKSLGLSLTVGNPGTDTLASYIGVMDVTVIYESGGLPSLSALGGWHTQYSPDHFAVIPYGTALDTTWVQSARSLVGNIYLTSDTLPNPWDSLPSYFSNLLAALE